MNMADLLHPSGSNKKGIPSSIQIPDQSKRMKVNCGRAARFSEAGQLAAYQQ